jgi:uncharacterized membrane protein (UPF0127 family)
MNFKNLSVHVYALILFVTLCSCSYAKTETTELIIITADGTQVSIRAEVARSDAERQKGLMYRKELADGQGMLFVFEKDQSMSFWMKNTFVPLSIAFITSDGRIIEIHDMEPQSFSSVHSNRSCRYALEVPQGWFSRVHIGIGDTVLRISEIGA